MSLSLIRRSFKNELPIRLDKRLFLDLIKAISAAELNEGIKDRNLVQHIKKIFPTKLHSFGAYEALHTFVKAQRGGILKPKRRHILQEA